MWRILPSCCTGRCDSYSTSSFPDSVCCPTCVVHAFVYVGEGECMQGEDRTNVRRTFEEWRLLKMISAYYTRGPYVAACTYGGSSYRIKGLEPGRNHRR